MSVEKPTTSATRIAARRCCSSCNRLRLGALELVGPKIAKRSGEEGNGDAALHGAAHQVTDRMLTFGRPALLHVDEQRRRKGRAGLREHASDDVGDVTGRRVALGADDTCGLVEHLRDEKSPGLG